MRFPLLPWGHSMKLDSENQRQTLMNCIMAAELSGTVKELMPLLAEIAKLADTVKSAEIEPIVTSREL